MIRMRKRPTRGYIEMVVMQGLLYVLFKCRESVSVGLWNDYVGDGHLHTISPYLVAGPNHVQLHEKRGLISTWIICKGISDRSAYFANGETTNQHDTLDNSDVDRHAGLVIKIIKTFIPRPRNCKKCGKNGFNG